MKFYRRLRSLRKEKGFTRYRLAKETGLSLEGISKLEGKGSNPTLNTLVKLAEAFGLSVPELLSESQTNEDRNKAAGQGAANT